MEKSYRKLLWRKINGLTKVIIDMSPPANSGPYEAYRGDAPYVFVSYSHQDEAAVHAELLRLKKLGFKIWYDEGVSPGSHWSDELAERITNCKLFLFYVTPRSVASQNCRDEANFVLEAGNPFLAVHLEETILPPGLHFRMGSRQAILRYELEADTYQSKLYAAITSRAPELVQADLSQGFRLGDYKVEPLSGNVTGPDGEVHHLEPKVMDVFVQLAEHPNELVTRDQLLKAVWPGQVAADELLTRAVSELRRVLHNGTDTKYIETVPKRGYRLVSNVLPVEGRQPELSVEDDLQATPPTKRKWTYTSVVIAALAIIILVSMSYLPNIIQSPSPTLVKAEKSIAVLPFENLSPDPDDSYFTAGIHEEILNQLATLRNLRVISRTSAMRYANSPLSIPDIARELNVDAIVQGSVRFAGNRIRIAAQLIDGETDEHLWSESYDRDRTAEDIFAIQRDIATAIARTLRAALSPEEIEQLQRVPTQKMESYNAYLLGNDFMRRHDVELAVPLYLRAVDVDPRFAEAWAALAIAHLEMYRDLQGDPTESRLKMAEGALEKAFALMPNLPEAHLARGIHLSVIGEYAKALEEYALAEHGMPGDARVFEQRAYVHALMGDLRKSLALRKSAIELDPLNMLILHRKASTHLFLREYAHAERDLTRALEFNPQADEVYFRKAVLIPLIRDGDVAAARSGIRNAPMHQKVNQIHWLIEIYSRDYDAAIEILNGEDFPDIVARAEPKALYLADTYRYAGQHEQARQFFEEALAHVEEALESDTGDPQVHIAHGGILAGLGKRQAALEETRKAFELAKQDRRIGPHQSNSLLIDAIFWVYMHAGDDGTAILMLDQYLSSPGIWSIEGLLPDPAFDELRDDPRFQALVAKYRRH